ncbi:MAG: flagellar biosynthetic protein FliO [Burkholderiales bacterium]|nr:flagellar biosynthetic protein FliO [Burkholderiales bacterium]
MTAAAADAPAITATGSVTSLLQVVFALLLVLAAIALFAWFMRRFAAGQAAAGGLLKVVGGVMVGPRERVVVVEVQDTWLLLGVASGQVTLLHSMARPQEGAQVPVQAGGFARVLAQVRAAKGAKR